MKDITIKKIPSFNSAKSYAGWIPEKLEDTKLVSIWAKISVILRHSHRGSLPEEYYRVGSAGSCIGRIPREAWLIHNLEYSKEEYWKEIIKRNLQDSFSVWDETRTA